MKRNEQELFYEILDNWKKCIEEWGEYHGMPSDKCEVIISDLKRQKQEVLLDIYNMAGENIDNSTK